MPVDLIIEGAVAKVVLNRPERLNALTWEMRRQLPARKPNGPGPRIQDIESLYFWQK